MCFIPARFTQLDVRHENIQHQGNAMLTGGYPIDEIFVSRPWIHLTAVTVPVPAGTGTDHQQGPYPVEAVC
jgi:hypothetical protein